MFRIDTTGAVTVLPAMTALGTPGFFTEGAPALGTSATVVSADWLNSIQEEMMAFLTAAGIAPVKGTNNQVLTAVKELISEAVPSGTTPWTAISGGYYRVENGIMELIFTVNASGTQRTDADFPKPFSAVPLVDISSSLESGNGDNVIVNQDTTATTETGVSFLASAYAGQSSHYASDTTVIKIRAIGPVAATT